MIDSAGNEETGDPEDPVHENHTCDDADDDLLPAMLIGIQRIRYAREKPAGKAVGKSLHFPVDQEFFQFSVLKDDSRGGESRRTARDQEPDQSGHQLIFRIHIAETEGEHDQSDQENADHSGETIHQDGESSVEFLFFRNFCRQESDPDQIAADRAAGNDERKEKRLHGERDGIHERAVDLLSLQKQMPSPGVCIDMDAVEDESTCEPDRVDRAESCGQSVGILPDEDSDDRAGDQQFKKLREKFSEDIHTDLFFWRKFFLNSPLDLIDLSNKSLSHDLRIFFGGKIFHRHGIPQNERGKDFGFALF